MHRTVEAQDRINLVGTKVERRYTIPAIEEQTTHLTAGRLDVGVEFRILDDTVLKQSYTAEEMEFVNRHRPESGFDTYGVAFHVIDRQTGSEYLRFDCFLDDPHYHYLPHEEWQYVVAFDAAAGDDFLDWTIARFRNHLPGMLRFVSADELAAAVNEIDMQAFTDQIERLARSAMAGASLR